MTDTQTKEHVANYFYSQKEQNNDVSGFEKQPKGNASKTTHPMCG